MSLPSVSGYSGGGRTMIEAYEAGTAAPYEAYALGLTHKHIPEIMRYTGLTRRPVFIPAVGNFRQGMLVQLPLHLDLLPGQPPRPAICTTRWPATTAAPTRLSSGWRAAAHR